MLDPSVLLAPVFVAGSYALIVASQSLWLPLLMLFGGRGVSKGTGGPSASSSSTSRAGSQHQTVHVSVAAAAAAPEAAPEVAVALQRTDAHTLPSMYAFAASGLLWVASEAAVDEGAVAAVAGAAAVSVLFIAKMADRLGSGNLCVLMMAALALGGKAAVLARNGGA